LAKRVVKANDFYRELAYCESTAFKRVTNGKVFNILIQISLIEKEMQMSGYDPEYNIFELTATKANYWFRREDFPPELIKRCECCGTLLTGKWDLMKAILEWQGIEILKDSGNYMHVVATPEKLWEALSGKPSTPENAQAYYKNPIKSSSRKMIDERKK
jgi:hypothetical protein